MLNFLSKMKEVEAKEHRIFASNVLFVTYYSYFLE